MIPDRHETDEVVKGALAYYLGIPMGLPEPHIYLDN